VINGGEMYLTDFVEKNQRRLSRDNDAQTKNQNFWIKRQGMSTGSGAFAMMENAFARAWDIIPSSDSKERQRNNQTRLK